MAEKMRDGSEIECGVIGMCRRETKYSFLQ